MKEDIFNSLLDVEQDASNMVFEAQVEADDKITAVKKEIGEKYKSLHDEIVAKLEDDFEKQKTSIDTTATTELKDYQDVLTSIKPNFDAFNNVLDSYFFLEVSSKNARSDH